MNALEWVLKLKDEGILAESPRDGKAFLHLSTPCKIHLTAAATKHLQDEYVPHLEKGGYFVAIPERRDGVTHLTVDRIIFLPNVSESPERSYLPSSDEVLRVLKETYSGSEENALPISFHTHPTHSDNVLGEMFTYLHQSDTSQ